MNAGIKITNMPDVSATLREYAKHSKKTSAEIVNAKALDWSFKSLEETDKANVNQIAFELGQIATEKKTSKKGRVSFKRIFKTDTSSLAHRIINARLRKSGKPMIWGDELDKAARGMIAARMKAVAFIKSGWLPAIKALARVTRGKSSSKEAKIRGQEKGFAVVAREMDKPTAMIVNTATKDSARAAAEAEAGLRKGAARVIADMQIYIERKMQEMTNKRLGKK